MKTTTLCAMLVGLTLTPWPVKAHDIYGKLIGTHGESCCRGHDCRPAPWRIVNGKWISVHHDAIQYRTLEGEDGKTNGSAGRPYARYFILTARTSQQNHLPRVPSCSP